MNIWHAALLTRHLCCFISFRILGRSPCNALEITPNVNGVLSFTYSSDDSKLPLKEKKGKTIIGVYSWITHKYNQFHWIMNSEMWIFQSYCPIIYTFWSDSYNEKVLNNKNTDYKKYSSHPIFVKVVDDSFEIHKNIHQRLVHNRDVLNISRLITLVGRSMKTVELKSIVSLNIELFDNRSVTNIVTS